MAFELGEQSSYRRLVDEALAHLDADDPDPRGAERLFAQAASLVPPGFDRSFVLGQLATLALEDDRPADVVELLLSVADWPHHVPAAFATLTRAAVEARSIEAFRWLATRPGEYHDPTPAVLDHGVRIALRAGDAPFARELVALASELCSEADSLVPLLQGLVLEKDGRPADAIHAYQRAAELEGSDARIYRRLTLLLDREKKPDEAREWCRRALELDLEASARQEIEKRIARLEAPTGAKRSAAASVLPLYVRSGSAQIERTASFPVQVTRAVQAGEKIWASGTRRSRPHLFICSGDAVAEFPLEIRPTDLFPHPRGEMCLVIGIEGNEDPAGLLVQQDGSVVQLSFQDRPNNVVVLPDGWLCSYRAGDLERWEWSGQLRWRSRLPDPESYAHFFAADSDLCLASHLNQIFELRIDSGEVLGSVAVEAQPTTMSAGGFEIEFEISGFDWVLGLGVRDGRGFAVADQKFSQISHGPDLQLQEKLEGDDAVRFPLHDESGRLLAFRANDSFRAVLPDGSLASPVAAPWDRRDLAPLEGDLWISYGGTQIAAMDAGGHESYVFEAAKQIRSLGPVGSRTIRTVIGRDVLRVDLD
jgi:tetratricopeptide (TPR) repeat protein